MIIKPFETPIKIICDLKVNTSMLYPGSKPSQQHAHLLYLFLYMDDEDPIFPNY